MAKDKDVVIRFDHVTKIYKLYKNERARFRGLFFKNIPYKTNKASNDLCFTIKKGDAVSLIGRNGAGKSTILKMITGVTYPTSGTVEVNGKISALLELSAGFDSNFTGRENIHLKCELMGFTKEEIDAMEPGIIEFADIGDYIDQPLRSYSSGMKARLGFAICVSVKPDILIIDEALSVGDRAFRRKCTARVREIMESEDVTLLFVTHSLDAAMDFCKRGIVLEKGTILFDGDIQEAIEFYDARN